MPFPIIGIDMALKWGRYGIDMANGYIIEGNYQIY